MDDDPQMSAIDPITRLPWSVALRTEGTAWITRSEIHAVCIQVAGLGTLMDVFGYRAGHSILAQVARLLRMQLDGRDLLGRHSGDAFLILTQRPYDEIRELLNRIRDRVFTLSIETAEGRVPEGRFGVAGTDPVANPADAYAALDALIISAEIALRGGEPGKEAARGQAPAETTPAPSPAPAVSVPEVIPPAEEPAAGGSIAEAPTPVHELPTPELSIPEIPEIPLPGPVEAVPAAAEPAEAPAPSVEPVTPPPEPVVAHEVLAPGEVLAPAEAPAAAPAPPLETAREDGAGKAPREDVVPAEAAAVEAPQAVAAAPAPGESHRVSLVRWNLAEGGLSATVEVEVQYGERHAVGRVVGRNAPDRIPYLVGEATARALTELLPPGYGVILQDIQSVSHGEHQALWVAVMLMSPAGEEKLLGIAPGNENKYAGTARAVLNAINRRLSLVLNQVSRSSADR